MARGFFFLRSGTAMTTENNHSDSIRSIVRRYYTVWWFQAFGPSFIFAIYPLFMRWRGLNQLQINSVAATFFLVTFITDIPTGAFADAIGRRTAFIIGSALSTVGFMVYFFAHRFPMFLVGELFDGVGFTFRNGAVDAWAVDALDAAGYAGTKDRLFSRVSQLTRIGNMAGALIGAYAGARNLAMPWLLGSCGLALSGTVGGLLMDREPRRSGQVRSGRDREAGARADGAGDADRVRHAGGPAARAGRRDSARSVGPVVVRVARVLQRSPQLRHTSCRMVVLPVQSRRDGWAPRSRRGCTWIARGARCSWPA